MKIIKLYFEFSIKFSVSMKECSINIENVQSLMTIAFHMKLPFAFTLT